MAQLVVEIHVPLLEAPGLSAAAYTFPWIDDIEDFLADQDEVEVFDECEEVGDDETEGFGHGRRLPLPLA